MRVSSCFVIGLLVCCSRPPPASSSDPPDASVPDAGTAPVVGDPRAVTTQHVDNLRTGANVHETVLTPAVVSKGFGKIATRTVQGYTLGQPLFVPDLVVKGSTRDVVFVATEHNDVYAFDANDPEGAPPLWHVWLGRPVGSSEIGFAFWDIVPEMGVTSTPVIDRASGTLFVFAQTHEEPGVFRNTIHALDIHDGQERGRKEIDTSIDAQWTLQRPGLAIDDRRGVLWIAGGGHADTGPYHGWVVALDARTATLDFRGRYITTPNGLLGGIWQSGTAPAIDEEGAVYFETGNGTFDPRTDPPNIGDSFGKIALGTNPNGGIGGIVLADWFTPHDQAQLDVLDADLGSSGPVLIPGTKLLVGAGKQGKLYVIDRTKMGHFREGNDDQIVQAFPAMRSMFSAPVFWRSRLYATAGDDPIRAFRFLGEQGRFEEKPFLTSTIVSNGPSIGALAISSNGDANGIVWALTRLDGSPSDDGPGVLHALDAEDLTRILWSSDVVANDAVGSQSKFVTPTVAGGKLFVPTADGRLLIYGPKP